MTRNRFFLFHWPNDKIFYGWVIVAAALVTVSTLIGIRFSFGIFFKSLEAEFGLTRAATSSVFSTYTLFTAVFVIISGWALDKYGPKLVVIGMGLFTGLSLIITSQATSLWQVFLSYSVILSIGTAGGLTVLMSVVSRWFHRKRGFAVGIAMSGTGLGTLVMAPFAAYLISALSWRMSYIVLGLVAWLVVISFAMLLRRDPGEIGALPDGAKSTGPKTEAIHKNTSAIMTGLSLAQALKTRSFWLMLFAWLLYAFCLNFVLTHIVPHATDTGISNMQAATIVSVMGVFHIISRLFVGRISDVISRKFPAIICSLFGCVALTWVIWSQGIWMFYVFAILFGLAWGGIGVTTISMVGDIFGERKLGTIMGTIDAGFALGSAAGSALGGIIFDATNSYTLAFTTGAVAMLILAALLAFTRPEAKLSAAGD